LVAGNCNFTKKHYLGRKNSVRFYRQLRLAAKRYASLPQKNVNMEIPFRLDEGIYFENSEQMLFWGDNFDLLQKIDNPEISEDGETLKWFGKLCLGGQKLNIIIYRNQYTNKNGVLETVSFEEENETQLSIYKTAEKYSVFFEKYFGKPSQVKTIYERTTELWNIDDLQIILGIGERFTDFLIFGMHYGERKFKLTES